MTSTHRIVRRGVRADGDLALTCGGVSARGPGSARAYQATVTVAPTTVTRPLPQGFIGLAFTYRALPRWMSARGPSIRCWCG